MSPSCANWPDRWQESHGDRSRKSGGLSSYDRIMRYTTDETEELYELVRDHHLHIDLNVMGVGPRVGPGVYPIDQWTESQKSETIYRHE
jgi:hypothetical protein